MKDITVFKFHLSEIEFNPLSSRDKLSYLLDRFHIGMFVAAKVNGNPAVSGTVFGFYKSGDPIEYILNGKSKSYSEMPSDLNEYIPGCNVVIENEYGIVSYYPLWIYPDFVKIRNNKLEEIGI
jgi:hypothetical protein